MFTESQITGSINTVDRQLLYDIRELLKENNALLRKLTSEHNQDEPVEISEYDGLKRPELMKRIAKLENKPTGWNKWGTEDMRKFLKEAN